MKKLFAALCAVLIVGFCVKSASAQPAVNTISTTKYQVWPILSTNGAHTLSFVASTRDTMAHATARTALADTVTTDSVYIEGARGIYLTCSSIQPSNSTAVIGDSIAVPVAWIRHGEQPGIWEQVPTLGANRHLPVAANGYFSVWTATLNTVPNPSVVWHLVPDGSGAGTPVVIPSFWWRWRIRSNDVRDYLNGAAVPVPGKTGTFNYTVNIIKF